MIFNFKLKVPSYRQSLVTIPPTDTSCLTYLTFNDYSLKFTGEVNILLLFTEIEKAHCLSKHTRSILNNRQKRKQAFLILLKCVGKMCKRYEAYTKLFTEFLNMANLANF